MSHNTYTVNIREIVEQALQVLQEYPEEFPAELTFEGIPASDIKIYNYVGMMLLRHGMIYWQSDSSDEHLVVCFRPFSYELDTSLLATLHH